MYIPQKYKIINIKKFTPDVKLIRVKSNLNPLPGQFFEVSILGIGECPLASCSYENNYLDILVRDAGSVTSALFNLKENDEIFIRGPYGKGFPIKKLKKKNLITIAGGTGIAPITSLIEYVEKNRKDFGNVKIFFGFRNENYILLKGKIDRWQKKFDVTICLDKKEKKNNFQEGFLHQIISKNKFSVKDTIAFLCGPEIMMSSVSEVLNNFGLKNNKIYWSMERRMECGMGNCGRCLIQDIYVCKDGPVFRYDILKPKLENEASANKTEYL
ncbi:MAG: FAD/NAD(P)-binding protein [Nanoarchaeota archaeon]